MPKEILLSIDGFLVVDKAQGMTSHDVVAIARRSLGTKKVGHAGTLDPMATGVLVLAFGIGTRMLQYITDGEKAYEATVVLGASTVSDDSDGEVLTIATAEALRAISDGMIEESLSQMRGVFLQRPSSVSAVKVAGKRAYDRVREGEEVELASREVTISRLDVIEIRRLEDKIEFDISVVCGSGTFIRAIARDCGQALGVGGHLSSLRRTLVAPFDLSQAISTERLKDGTFTALTVEDVAMMRFPIRVVTDADGRELHYGRALSRNETPNVTAAIWNDKLVALLVNRNSHAHPVAVFARDPLATLNERASG